MRICGVLYGVKALAATAIRVQYPVPSVGDWLAQQDGPKAVKQSEDADKSYHEMQSPSLPGLANNPEQGQSE